MAWRKPNPELIDLLASTIEGIECELRPMFGCPAYFTNGYLFTGVHQDIIMLRLPVELRAEMTRDHDEVIPFEPMMGRIMKAYVVLPETVVNDPGELRKWLEHSHAHTMALPPKPPKKRKARH
jgi:TfoX/Sxy family transcriptional regulator of competence genes